MSDRKTAAATPRNSPAMSDTPRHVSHTQIPCSTSPTAPRSPPTYFFFQAEDGIRGADVTGVQTCALPIFLRERRGGKQMPSRAAGGEQDRARGHAACSLIPAASARAAAPRFNCPAIGRLRVRPRSEERRVGEECRSRGVPEHYKGT